MDTENLIRLGAFVGLFAVFALWEMATPRRRLTARKSVRWFSNLALVAMNSLLVPLLVPIVALGMAKLAQEQGWGLLNNFSVPYLVAFVCTLLALDFIIYLQHVMFHSVPILWRLHRVHHSDVDLDVSSGTRFHIFEILISMGIKVAAIALIVRNRRLPRLFVAIRSQIVGSGGGGGGRVTRRYGMNWITSRKPRRSGVGR